jgi:hypothetical protein
MSGRENLEMVARLYGQEPTHCAHESPTWEGAGCQNSVHPSASPRFPGRTKFGIPTRSRAGSPLQQPDDAEKRRG